MNSTGNSGFDAFADVIAARVVAFLNQSTEPRLMTVKEAAAYLGRSPKALRHLIASDAIPVVREDRRVYLDRGDLDQWIEMRKTKR